MLNSSENILREWVSQLSDVQKEQLCNLLKDSDEDILRRERNVKEEVIEDECIDCNKR